MYMYIYIYIYNIHIYIEITMFMNKMCFSNCIYQESTFKGHGFLKKLGAHVVIDVDSASNRRIGQTYF